MSPALPFHHRPPLLMADIIKDRVYIPSAAFIFPITPGFVGQPVRISSPTPTGQGSTSTKKSRNAKIKDENKIREKLSGDDGCFLTGYACLSLEVAHLVNAVQKKGNKARLDKVVGPVLMLPRRHPHITT